MQTEELVKLNKDIALLELSALKWQRIAYKEASDDSIDDCALCGEYYKTEDFKVNSCAGCPISEDTGKQFCAGSPYDIWTEYVGNNFQIAENIVFDATSKECAIGMLRYLQQLRDARLIQLESATHVPPDVSSAASSVHV